MKLPTVFSRMSTVQHLICGAFVVFVALAYGLYVTDHVTWLSLAVSGQAQLRPINAQPDMTPVSHWDAWLKYQPQAPTYQPYANSRGNIYCEQSENKVNFTQAVIGFRDQAAMQASLCLSKNKLGVVEATYKLSRLDLNSSGQTLRVDYICVDANGDGQADSITIANRSYATGEELSQSTWYRDKDQSVPKYYSLAEVMFNQASRRVGELLPQPE